MSQFPNLLRRSSFATHDPLITRIYTSTPSSVSKYGDWGLKYPIHRKKGPRHIRFSQLDAGSAIGADWRSGEREARFMEQWGSGRAAWSRNSNGLPNSRQRPNSILDDASVAPEPETGGKTYVPAIESMSEQEFERYLEEVRAHKDQALQRYWGNQEAIGKKKVKKVHNLSKEEEKAEEEATKKEEQAREHASREGRRSMVWLAVEGKLDVSHGVDEMGEMSRKRIASPQSSVLVTQPHELGGIAYSKHTGMQLPLQYVHPSTAIAGRALDRLRQIGRSNQSGVETNTPIVVGAGGLTGQTEHDAQHSWTRDEQMLKTTDYSREDPARGSGMFRIRSAQLASDPTVLNLNDLDLSNYYDVPSEHTYRPPQSRAQKPSPLDTFRHNIKFDFNPTATATAFPSNSDTAKPPAYMQLGSREYVARPRPQFKHKMNRSDHLGLAGSSSIGGPRAGRPTGAGLRELDKMRERRAQEVNKTLSDGISNLMARVGRASSAPANDGQGSVDRAQRPASAAQGAQSSFRDARRASRR